MKHHFDFCPRLTGSLPIGAGALRPSCRPLRFSSQTPAAAGSHLYTAQQDSVRSGTLSAKSYRLSWVTPSPLWDSWALLGIPLLDFLQVAALSSVSSWRTMALNFPSRLESYQVLHRSRGLPLRGCLAASLEVSLL